jgi:transposase-like protein
MYLYRAIDQYGQVIDVLVPEKRDLAATRRFFTRALQHSPRPTEVTTDRHRPTRAWSMNCCRLPTMSWNATRTTLSNLIMAGLKARLRPMRGLNRLRSIRVISLGHAFIENLHHGHYELGVDGTVALSDRR